MVEPRTQIPLPSGLFDFYQKYFRFFFFVFSSFSLPILCFPPPPLDAYLHLLILHLLFFFSRTVGNGVRIRERTRYAWIESSFVSFSLLTPSYFLFVTSHTSSLTLSRRNSVLMSFFILPFILCTSPFFSSIISFFFLLLMSIFWENRRREMQDERLLPSSFFKREQNN